MEIDFPLGCGGSKKHVLASFSKFTTILSSLPSYVKENFSFGSTTKFKNFRGHF
jgi:hypothetical protein